MARKRVKPRWLSGLPDAPGLWLCEWSSGDLEAWKVERDADDMPEGGLGPDYLRMSDGISSEPVVGYRWPPLRSFGPVPMADGVTDLKSVRVK